MHNSRAASNVQLRSKPVKQYVIYCGTNALVHLDEALYCIFQSDFIKEVHITIGQVLLSENHAIIFDTAVH